MRINCKPQNKKEYFSEKEMIKLVNIYQKNKSEQIFKEMKPSIQKMINGMINKQFSYNYHIINNRGDAISECYYQILTSLERYDSNKGRLFAYLNRIIKNTLMKYYNDSRKIKDKEMNYTDLSKNLENNEDVDTDNFAMISGINNTDDIINDNYNTNNELTLKSSLDNKVLDRDDTIYITYHYILNLRDIFKYFIDNDYSNYIIENINNEFEFNINYLLMSKEDFYKRLINNLYNIINEIIKWIEQEYSKEVLYFEPETYNGQLSSRAIGYIRNFINTKLKIDNMSTHLRTDDLINFIYYLIDLRYNIDEKK